MNETLDEGVRYLPEDTFTGQSEDHTDPLISVDLTQDETDAEETLDSLVNDNPGLVKYLLDGAEEDTDPNVNISIVLDDEDAGAGSTSDTTADPGNWKGSKK